MDRHEQIIEEIRRSLYPGLRQQITDVAAAVHRLGGLFVPAHIDRKMNGIYNQLGLFPEDLDADTVEIFRNTNREDAIHVHPEIQGFQLLKGSDAHFIDDIGRCSSLLEMEECSFQEIKKALKGQEGRRVVQE